MSETRLPGAAGRALFVSLAAAVTLGAVAGAQQVPAVPSAGGSAPRCAALPALRLPDVRLTDVQYVAAAPGATGAVRVAHCRATGVIGTEVGFSVWLPDVWNGRFLMNGGGGYVGSIPGPGPGVDQGFAVTSTDTGHRSQGVDASWALDHLERQLNFGYLATHRTAETAKAIIRNYYGNDAHHSYFTGCSTGGRQALMEAQRFPADFDGVVSGAPVFDWTRVLAAGIKNAQAAFPNSAAVAKPIVTVEALRLLQRSVLEACDARDGVADGVIGDPAACRFDLATIRGCDGDLPAGDCLTKPQRTAIARVYSPLRDDHGIVYEGQPVGAEAEPGAWQAWITGNSERPLPPSGQPTAGWGFSTQFFKNFVFGDPSWDYTTYDVEKSWRRDTKFQSSFLNAENADLGAFRARGGRLLLWHGWADPALNPFATVRYYKDVMARDPQAADYARLFLLPGVLHCAGGPGPDQFDKIAPIVDWLEKGIAPSSLVVRKAAAGGVPARSRPVCAFPAQATYTGSGSTDDAANFVCK